MSGTTCTVETIVGSSIFRFESATNDVGSYSGKITTVWWCRLRCTSKRILILLLFVHVAMLAWGALVHSPTIDEVEWLPGGWASWKTGRLDIVNRNPPHLGLWAALPLLFVDHDQTAANTQRSARSIGREFIRTNGQRAFWLFTLGRWACIPFSIVGAVVCFVWARDLYGPRSGLLAATLWCFCPNILAHGQLVAHDVPATSLGLVGCFAFWRWLHFPSWKTTVSAGVCLGLALLMKMTILIYLVLWPIVWFAWYLGDPTRRRPARRWFTGAALLATILVVAIDVVNVGYVFQGSFAKINTFVFRSELLGRSPDGHGNRFSETWLGRFPVPFPHSYIVGLDRQRFALEGGIGSQGSYLRGRWSTDGTPYFYLYALAIKVPLGTWCLLLLSIIFRIRRVDVASKARDELVLLAPAVGLFLVASLSAGYEEHFRYILPCFPYVFIWIARLANTSVSRHPRFTRLVVAATTWAIVSSLWIYPHSLSYFNELVSGPRYGHYHLLGSNIDYGQDLIKLRHWYQRHPHARPIGLAYWDLASVDPHIAGIDYFVPVSGLSPGAPIDQIDASNLGPKPGWYAVNVNALHGDHWPARKSFPRFGFYGYFLSFTPVAHVGYSILIYHITADEANYVRKQLGLPLLDCEHTVPENQAQF